jgi:hypothetical protein
MFWSKDWQEVIQVANFRAWATKRRYKVVYEPNNGWWTATETVIHL